MIPTMTPQLLHDAWLVMTVLTFCATGGVATFLLVTFKRSEHRWFFFALAILLLSITVNQITAGVKNYFQAPTVDISILYLWLIGRFQEAVIATLVLFRIVFGPRTLHPMPSSGDLPPAHWDEKFADLGKKIDELKK